MELQSGQQFKLNNRVYTLQKLPDLNLWILAIDNPPGHWAGVAATALEAFGSQYEKFKLVTKIVKKFYIKERRNPQVGVYYVLLGALTRKDAKKHENTLYGNNIIHKFDTQEEYLNKIEELVEAGMMIQ